MYNIVSGASIETTNQICYNERGCTKVIHCHTVGSWAPEALFSSPAAFSIKQLGAERWRMKEVPSFDKDPVTCNVSRQAIIYQRFWLAHRFTPPAYLMLWQVVFCLPANSAQLRLKDDLLNNSQFASRRSCLSFSIDVTSSVAIHSIIVLMVWSNELQKPWVRTCGVRLFGWSWVRRALWCFAGGSMKTNQGMSMPWIAPKSS